MELFDPLRLVGHDQSPLPVGVLRCDAGRAMVGMAGLALDAADGEHEGAGHVHPVRAQGHGAGNVEGRDHHAGRAELDLAAQARADQSEMHKGQPFAQGHAHMVDELGWRRAGAALLAVDDDEIRGHAGFEHGFDDGEKFMLLADTELEADGFAAGQSAQLLDEGHELQGR